MVNLSLEWNEVKLEDVGKIITGKTPKTSIEDNYGGHIPFLTPSDDMNVKIIKYTNKTLTLKGLNEVKNCLIPKNSVCVSCIGSDLGKVVLTSEDTVTNQQINSIIVNEKFDYNFIYYTMILLGKQLNYMSKSSTAVPIINKSTFSNELIFVPSLEEQKKISSILSNIDAKIDNLDKINKNLTICIDVNFKNNLLNFNQYSEQELVSSELGLIPKEWEVSNLTNIANYQNGLAMQKFPPENDADCFKVLKIKELRQGFFDETSDSCSKNIKEECIVYDGDVIFSWSGSLLVDIWTGGTCGLNQHLFKVTSSKFDKWFYYCWTKFYLDQFILIAKDKATTMGHIKRKHLDESLVLIPDKETYSKLTMLFKPLFDMLIKNKIEIKKLQNLRDVLMPKLMSGEVDVSKINCDLELKYNYMKYLFNQIHKQLSKSVV